MIDQPWKTEPDHLDLVLNCFQCEIIRVPLHGALCGYIDLPEWHPLFGHEFGESEALGRIEIHGGWTFSMMMESGKWRVGFDCAHAFDYQPVLAKAVMSVGGSGVDDPREYMRPKNYRTIEYVQDKLERATAELFEMMTAHQKMATLMEISSHRIHA